LPPCYVTSFADLTATFGSQFAANKTKRLEVAYLFDIKQLKTEMLKLYLAHFNVAMVQVDDPDQKFFIKAFHKGLWADPFSNSLALSRSASMTKIRARVEKHVEAEEDKEDRLQAKRVISAIEKKNTHGFQANHQYIPGGVEKFTPLKTSRAHIRKFVITNCWTFHPQRSVTWVPPKTNGVSFTRLATIQWKSADC
ncbi:hypothetical protein CR513_41153, partial [Mucuna pruriens]